MLEHTQTHTVATDAACYDFGGQVTVHTNRSSEDLRKYGHCLWAFALQDDGRDGRHDRTCVSPTRRRKAALSNFSTLYVPNGNSRFKKRVIYEPQ